METKSNHTEKLVQGGQKSQSLIARLYEFLKSLVLYLLKMFSAVGEADQEAKAMDAESHYFKLQPVSASSLTSVSKVNMSLNNHIMRCLVLRFINLNFEGVDLNSFKQNVAVSLRSYNELADEVAGQIAEARDFTSEEYRDVGQLVTSLARASGELQSMMINKVDKDDSSVLKLKTAVSRFIGLHQEVNGWSRTKPEFWSKNGEILDSALNKYAISLILLLISCEDEGLKEVIMDLRALGALQYHDLQTHLSMDTTEYNNQDFSAEREKISEVMEEDKISSDKLLPLVSGLSHKRFPQALTDNEFQAWQKTCSKLIALVTPNANTNNKSSQSVPTSPSAAV